jgi:hypothetical protein
MARSSVNFLPSYYRTDKNKKFLSSTLDQFIAQTELERLNGYIGSKLSPNYNPSKDIYITDPQPLRTKYQLEPGLIVKDLNGNIKNSFGYDDLINQLSFYGSNVSNLNKLFKPEFLSFDPQIDWDKLVNFREYYWLATGPEPVTITGTQRELISTYTISISADGAFFVFSPDGLTESPQVTLYRGVTYVFNITTAEKFYIKDAPGFGITDLYTTDIIGNGSAKNGQIILNITETTPDSLYYCSNSELIGPGKIVIKTIEENSYIDIEKEILGKASYVSANGVTFVNGLKVNFGGDVFPEIYKNKTYLVEGVGKGIILVDYDLLTTPEKFATLYDADFDAENFDVFPFDNFKNLPIDPSYITINRASKDLNPWTRYNRWFHSSVLEQIAKVNGTVLKFPVEHKAQRPIVEFRANLQLYNYGHTAITDITLIDTVTTDAFSNVEGSVGHWVDGISLDEGHKIVFNADTDSLVNGKVYEVTFVYINGQRTLNLVDTNEIVTIGTCVTVNQGITNAGTVWWYGNIDGKTMWVKGQQKTEINQAPLFDVFDDNGYSFGSYPYTSDFSGTKLFNYSVGTGAADPVLGFPLQYTNTGLESSYLFSNYFGTDQINRVYPDVIISQPVSSGYLKNTDNVDAPSYVNVWTPAQDYQIPVVQFDVLYDSINNIEITSFDNPGYITDISIDVFVNNIKYSADQYTIVRTVEKMFINFTTAIQASTAGNRIRLDIYSAVSPNSSGQYLTPINLTNNPLNGPVPQLTLAELFDHVNMMVNRSPEFNGVFPGPSNLGNLPTIATYGTRIISNSNPLSMAHYFITNRENNLIDAVQQVGNDYNQFRLNLIKLISQQENKGTPGEILDLVLSVLGQNKNIGFPYSLSDMVPYGTNKKTRTYTVTDSRNTAYAISDVFSPTTLSNKAIIVYLNGTQQLFGNDYTFGLYDPSVIFSVSLIPGDKIVIDEYVNTDRSYVPPTPSKLGLYPKFVPYVYTDASVSGEPVTVIQGHDGSLLVGFDDYRDDIILEFEKRVFNNIKTVYNQELFDVNSVLPGLFRTELFSYNSTYNLVSNLFKKWTSVYGIDYETNLTYSVDNHKTWNFKSAVDYLFGKTMPGSFRAIYKYYFDTDRPDTHPWEMLGITIKPDWWDSEYGPAPYTSGNKRLWRDLETGNIAQGATAGINPIYARPGLSQIIPVDNNGNIIDPRVWASIGENDSIPNTDQPWAWGDWGPAENAFRRSSVWPFAVQIIMALTKPANYSSKLFDVSRMKKNKAGQYVYGDKNSFITPASLALYSSEERTSGYSAFVVEAGNQKSSGYLTTLKSDLTLGNFNLFAKLGGFVSKDKLNIVIDAVQLGTQNPVPFLPNEDYTVHFNVSNPIRTLTISGIIIIKSNGKFIVRGYDNKDLFFTVYNPNHQKSDSVTSIGGKAEDYVVWTVGKYYQAGTVVYNQNAYYRVTISHTASSAFNPLYFTALSSLPILGGIVVQNAVKFETTETVVPYGTGFTTIQEVVDFLYGYGHWLAQQGFVFDDFNADFQKTINWAFTVEEFVYWTTQNWADNSVITLSPFANKLKFTFQEGVVDNLLDNFYEYSLLRADGLSFPANNFSLVRQGSELVISTKNTYEGIFFARLNVVQKEHALVFNNKTIFNDIIYAIDSGYRQRRLKLEGFRTAMWTGDFTSPGFVYDIAKVENWAPYVDYQPTDVVRYVGKYYSAIDKIPGSQTFNFAQWIMLDKKPQAQLLPNFDYKINQFEDFYSLDIDNFDAGQQKMAQHLTGYSPRSYLDNIFDNPISQYKFYQGYIKEKGTVNSLTKLEKASAASLQGKLELFEEWAFRLGHFGSYSSYQEIEFPLNESNFIENSQVLEFINELPLEQTKVISYITPADISIKPDMYVAENTFVTITGTYINNNLVLPTAGYARLDDVNNTFLNLTKFTSSKDQFSNGDKIWIAFGGNQDWGMYRYTRQPSFIKSVASANKFGEIQFTTNKHHGLTTGDIVSVAKMDSTVNGIYTVTSVVNFTDFTVANSNSAIPQTTPPGLFGKFENVRFNTPDDITNFEYLADIDQGELVWVDDIGDGRWGVLKKINNYAPTELLAPRADLLDQNFGDKLAKHATSSTMIISATQNFDDTGGQGRVYVYDTSNNPFRKIINYSLNALTDQYRPSNDVAPFGDVLVYDDTDELVFSAASNASYVRVIPGSFRVDEGMLTPFISSKNVGLVKISGFYKTGYRAEIPYAVLVDPTPQTASRFGSGIFVERSKATKKVLIGAPGHSTSGTVFRFQVGVETSNNTVSFQGLTGTNQLGVGHDAMFTATVYHGHYTVQIDSVNTGTAYSVGDIITIPGDLVGGVIARNDIEILVSGVNQAGSITGYVSTGSGATKVFTVTSSTTQWQIAHPYMPLDYSNEPMNFQFGYRVAGSKDGSIVAISSPGLMQYRGGVHVYTYDSSSDGYSWLQSIPNFTDIADTPEITKKLYPGDRFGEEIYISEDSNYLLASAPFANGNKTGTGKVWIYKWNGTKYKFLQLLENPSKEIDLEFGHGIALNSDNTTLSITSQGSNIFNSITFDDSSTTFDGNSCKIGQITKGSGSAYVYNRFANKFLLAQELFDGTVDTNSHYGKSVVVEDTVVYVGSPGSYISENNQSGSVYLWNEIDKTAQSWSLYRQQESLIDIQLINKASTINVLKEKVIDYLDVIDPLKGKIPGIAEQELTYKTPYDPAVYNYVTTTYNANVDDNSYWAADHVGELWWDLSSVKYVWYEQGELTYRKSAWGQLFPGVEIDVYEWVESQYSPKQWSALADTNAGLAKGISGQPKFIDDSIYSLTEQFNKNTSQFSNVYYFWVKNKVIAPNKTSRKISASAVTNILTNPKSYGLEYLAILSPNAVALTNFKNGLISDRIYLNIGFNRISNSIDRHTEWALVQENNENAIIPEYLEDRMINSLVGSDVQGNLIPDPTLSFRQKYGIQIRPKQSMFVNRLGALRNLIEYTNSILAKTRTRGFINFDRLNSKEEIPDVLLNEYDAVVDTVEGRPLIQVRDTVRAELRCELENGRISKIIIVNSGYGYARLTPHDYDEDGNAVSWEGPTVSVVNTNGSPVVIKTVINNTGSLIEATIDKSGYGYTEIPTLLVRAFTVIVKVDPDFNTKWSKYEWSGSAWIRIHTQDFNTTGYWKYIDWAADSYNSSKVLTTTVDEIDQLDTLDLLNGDYVRVNNPGDGYYNILRYTTAGQGTFNLDFDVVYVENGTIQLLDTLWDLMLSQLGYDNQTVYDQLVFDQTPDTELRQILNAIKNDIFVGPHRIYWNKLFFKTVKYALTEQKFLDWAFKTTFINVKNMAGVLDQRTTYRYQDAAWYENYLKEIKPFHTKIRNYTMAYQIGPDNSAPYENTNNFVSDFDVPSLYNNTLEDFETVSSKSGLLAQYPWKSWNNNYKLSVESIEIINSGISYKTTPQVHIIPAPGDNIITTATAVAYISYGRVREIEVTDGGYGYTQQPTVLIVGGGNTQLTTATAYAHLTNSLVRSTHITMKFDRIISNNTGTIGTSKDCTDIFVGDGSKYKFDLTWYSSDNVVSTDVYADGILVLNDEYYIHNFTSVHTPAGSATGYHKKYSQLVLNSVPEFGQIIKITYNKNIEIYSASERIRDYYNPSAGMIGKDLSQLMSGIDYPGVKIETMPFAQSAAWDVLPYEASSYANDIASYLAIPVAAPASSGSNSIVLTTTTGILIGQFAYIVSASTTTNLFTATTVQVVGINTSTKRVIFNAETSNNVSSTGTFIELWSFDNTSSELDSVIDGGNLAYTTALGLRPSDIILDGDGFLTPYTSYAPEEVVPGEVQESLSISVFTRESAGSPLIVNQTQVIESTSTDYIVNLTIRPASSSSVIVTLGGKYLNYGVDYSLDFFNSQLTINRSANLGIANITSVGVGGTEILGSILIEHAFPGTAEIETVLNYSEINSVYVTVNGQTLAQTLDNTLGYSLQPVSDTDNTARLIVTGLTDQDNIIQAWFFQSEYKGYSEIKEQLIYADGTTDTFTLIQPPGNVGPYHAQAIVELNGLRLTPPETTYYEVANNQTSYEIRPNEVHAPGTFDISQLEVYVNGVYISALGGFFLNKPQNKIEFDYGFIKQGDVIAISVILGSEYTIYNNQLILTNMPTDGDIIKTITFTNHDSSNIRTEVYPASSSNHYIMSRGVLDDNYVWVSIAGKPLINGRDFKILQDLETVEISRSYDYNLTDKVVITSFSDTVVGTVIGYRMFKDIFGTTHFRRLSQANTTFLTRELLLTDTEIHVENASVLPGPVISQNTPGVVFIQGERIEYFIKAGNVLSQLRRTTLGTCSRSVYPAGTSVVDQSYNQAIPVNEVTLVQTYSTSSNVFAISTVTSTSTGNGIILLPGIAPENQIQVFYAGKLLSTATYIVHDFNNGYDSGDISHRTGIASLSDTTFAPEYSINRIGQVVTISDATMRKLNTNTSTVTITVVKKTGHIWTDPGTSLLNSSTPQAQFLHERQSGLPDKYQYGKF